jgi:phage/plasmid-associated DNA primase
MSTNHKPEIPDGSEAIWDRLRLIPFLKRFEGKKADTDPPEKLREELPGVLAWAVRGCVEWGQHGLGSAKAVERATAEYRAETDVLDRFFDDVCVFGDKERVTKKELFEAWEEWCGEEGVNPETQTTFTKKVAERGVVKNFGEGKVGGIRVWKGLSVRSSAPNPPSPDEVPYPQNPCKHEGREKEMGHLGQDFSNVSTEPPTREGFSENELQVPQVPPEVVTTPCSWESDGLEIEYMPEGE